MKLLHNNNSGYLLTGIKNQRKIRNAVSEYIEWKREQFINIWLETETMSSFFALLEKNIIALKLHSHLSFFGFFIKFTFF